MDRFFQYNLIFRTSCKGLRLGVGLSLFFLVQNDSGFIVWNYKAKGQKKGLGVTVRGVTSCPVSGGS